MTPKGYGSQEVRVWVAQTPEQDEVVLEVRGKRFQTGITGQTPEECVAVLAVALKVFADQTRPNQAVVPSGVPS